MTTYALFQLRRGVSSLWKTKNTLLSEGEVGFETDTGKMRIGDGISAWNSLPTFLPSQYPDLPTTTVLGRYDDTDNGISIGGKSGTTGIGSISIGGLSGGDGDGSISIGHGAGHYGQGKSSIQIGMTPTSSGSCQEDNTIILNATGDVFSGVPDVKGACYIKPIRRTNKIATPLYLTNDDEVIAVPSDKLIVSPDLSVEEAIPYLLSNALIILKPAPEDQKKIILPVCERGTVVRLFNNGVASGNSYSIMYITGIKVYTLYPQTMCSLIRRDTDWIAIPSIINAVDFIV